MDNMELTNKESDLFLNDLSVDRLILKYANQDKCPSCYKEFNADINLARKMPNCSHFYC